MTLAKVSSSPPQPHKRAASICGHETSKSSQPKAISLDCSHRNLGNPCPNRSARAIATLGARSSPCPHPENRRGPLGSRTRAHRHGIERPNHRHRPASLSNPAARRGWADTGVLRRCCPNQVCAGPRGSCWSLTSRLGWNCDRGSNRSRRCPLQSNGVHQISSGILMVRMRGDRQAVLSIGHCDTCESVPIASRTRVHSA